MRQTGIFGPAIPPYNLRDKVHVSAIVDINAESAAATKSCRLHEAFAQVIKESPAADYHWKYRW